SFAILLERTLTRRWQVILSPLMMSEVEMRPWGHSPQWVDQMVVNYTPIMFANRALVILTAVVCLAIVCRLFRIARRPAKTENFSWLNLSAGSEAIYYDPPLLQPTQGQTVSDLGSVRVENVEAKNTAVPGVTSTNAGLRANLAKLAAALGLEFRLLR